MSETGASAKTRVFICYARVDLAFADRLAAGLRERGFQALIDRSDIHPSEPWLKRIEDLIAKADTVIFVISPEAVSSKVCKDEIAFAVSLNKRRIPIVWRHVTAKEVPKELRDLQWMNFDNPVHFGEYMDQLAEALETDIQWIRKHTEFGEHARRWDAAGRPGPGGLVLRPPLLEEAEGWVAWRPSRAPEPTEVTRAFIATSRAAFNQEEAEKKANIDRYLIGQSRFLADQSRQSLRTGDASAAILLALAGLPDKAGGMMRPHVAEAEAALLAAVHSPRDRVVLAGHAGWVDLAIYSVDGLRVLTKPSLKAVRLWDPQSGSEIAILGDEDTTVFAAVFSPDSALIATACNDCMLRLWNSASGERVAELTGHEGPVRTVAFSPDGRFLVSTSDDGTTRRWDVSTRTEVELIVDGQRPAGAVFSPDGQIIAMQFGASIILRRIDGGTENSRLEGHKGDIEMVSFSPNGTLVATASKDNTARLWDVISGRQLACMEGHKDSVTTIGFGPDGSRVITGAQDHTARIWECPSGKEVAVLGGHTGWIVAASFSPDGRFAMTASFDRTLRIWDYASASEIAVLRGHDEIIRGAAISPSSSSVITASCDWTARIWSIWPSSSVNLAGHNSDIRIARFSPDENIVATASADNTARLWDAVTGHNIAVIKHGDVVWDVAFSPDSSRVVSSSSDKTAIVSEVRDGRRVVVLRGHTDAVLSARFSPDGRRLVTAADDRNAVIWDVEEGRPVAILQGHRDRIVSVAFSPDGECVLTVSESSLLGGADDSVRLWDTETGRPIAVLRRAATPMAAAFSPDGKLIAIGYGGMFGHQCVSEVWSRETYRRISVLEGHQRLICDIAFSCDGRHIVTASHDYTACIWEALTGNLIVALKGHSDLVRSAVFGFGDRRVVTASSDKTVRLWDAQTGDSVAVLQGHQNDVRCAFLNQKGDRVLSASYDCTARLWPVFMSTDALIEFAKASVGRGLTREQLQTSLYDATPPDWYIELKKWPYHTREWQSWLAAKRTGQAPPLPVQPFMKYG